MQARHPSHDVLCVFCVAAILGGCHHAAFGKESARAGELATVAAEDLFHVGLLHARRGDLLRAEQYLSTARHQGYDEPTVVYWLVRVCVSAGRYHSALIHAASYLRDHPGNWGLRLVVASIHEALGDFERAQAELESIIKIEPIRSLPRYRLAMLYRRRPSASWRALPHLEAYLELDPEGPHAGEVRAVLEDTWDAGSMPEAIEHSANGRADIQRLQ